MSKLELDNVCCSYDGADVVQNVTVTIDRGQLSALIGPSGCGKTTLLRTILGLHRPRSGRVLLDGTPVKHGSGRVGYVPQLDVIDWSFPATVEEVLGMAWASRSIGPRLQPAQSKAIDHMLERLGLTGMRRRHLRQLSGGQQRRVFLARALLSHPQLLLLDEPTSGVDVKTRTEILALLRDINADGTTILFTSHELSSVASIPSIMCLNRRLVAYGPSAQVLTSEVLSETFETELLVHRQGDSVLVGEAVEQPGVGVR